jgi:membrane associated rhomboid family serine protease
MPIPGDPGPYPGQPAPMDYFHPPDRGAAYQWAPGEREALRHLNRLRLINLALFFPFLLMACLSITLLAAGADAAWAAILPGAIALVILAFVIRNKVTKARLRHRHGIQ